MEEFDSHTEHAHEQAHEAAQESHEKWIMGVALTAAILAALAAVTSMISGHHEHEAMMLQMKASDQWNQYQAKKLKTLLREVRIENFELAGKPAPADLANKVADSPEKLAEMENKAKGVEASAHFHDDLHEMFAIAVTLFQVAIAVSAISALSRRRSFWFVGIALGALALGFLCAGMFVAGGVVGHRPAEPKEENQKVSVVPGPLSARMISGEIGITKGS